MIQNPILPGFCPDPSIIRVGEDYYIANSSFEWWPGVKIYHSKDLKHYEQLPSPLNRMSQLNMVGEGDSMWRMGAGYFLGRGILLADLYGRENPYRRTF